MKQNLTRKPVISRFFSVVLQLERMFIIPALLGKTGITGLIFFCKETFFKVLG